MNTIGRIDRKVRLAAGPVTAVLLIFCSKSLEAQDDLRQAVQVALPATVAVEWRDESKLLKEDAIFSPKPLPLGERPADSPPRAWPSALAFTSGTVISADGLIVTIGAAPTTSGRLTVTLSDGRSYAANVVVDDRRCSLQLLKVVAESLPHLEFAESEAELGQTVACTWSESTADRLISRGIVTARQRSLPNFVAGLIQTDASVGAASAGAPLVDASGKLLGIIVAKEARDAESPRAAFAVPVSAIRSLLAARQEGVKVVVQGGYMGVQFNSHAQQTAVVERVMPDSSAAAAGLREKDQIIVINGGKVATPDDVRREIGSRRAGEKVRVVILRDGKELELEIVLDSRNDQPSAAVLWPETAKPSLLRRSPVVPRASADPYPLYDLPQPPIAVAPVIRVERSDVETRLEKLNEGMAALQRQLAELTAQVTQLRDELKPTTPK